MSVGGSAGASGEGMRLDRLRGHGSWFAFASPALLVVSFIYLVAMLAGTSLSSTEPPPGWFFWAVAVWLILLAVAVLSGLVVAIDLEWIEHPRTHTVLTYVGLAGAAVGTVAFAVTMLSAFVSLAVPVTRPTVLLVLFGFGVYLTLMNFVGRRAGLLGGYVSGIGMAGGVLFLLGGVMLISGFGIGAAMILPAILCYMIWSAWLGAVLRRQVSRE